MTNTQGDVLGIYNSSGNKVAGYEYDTWGNVISITDANGNAITNSANIGIVNPIRYRGYCYDTETGYYYLQSRYYDPSICRFINADAYKMANITKDMTSGTNIFVYCNNNPTNYQDKSGLWVWLMSGWRKTNNGFDVDMNKKFLSRPFCRSFAKFVINYYGNGINYKKMNRHRIEVELWAHAAGYYSGKILNKVNRNWGNGWIKSGSVINVNCDDNRAWKYYLLWDAASVLKYQAKFYSKVIYGYIIL